MSLPVTIAKGIGITSLFLVRNAPSILTAGGVCAMIGATVTAVKQSLRYHEEVSEPVITDLALAEVEGDEKKRDAAKWRLIINTARRYAPTIVLTAAGIAMISAGHGMMLQRVSGLSSALALASSRVGAREKYQQITAPDGYNPQTPPAVKAKMREALRHVLPDADVHNWAFMPSNPNWTDSQTTNELFLESMEHYANDRLERYGHLFLNEVYDMLGMPRTRLGAVMGWLKDDVIDFGIERRFEPLEDADPRIWWELAFNADSNLITAEVH